ncbi:MAG: hypothetical protein AAFR23_06370, partial [Pseudomonadota bacterium]
MVILVEKPSAPHASGTGAVVAIRPPPIPLIGQSRDALGTTLRDIGVPDKQIRMRTQQLWSWVYVRGAQSFDDMTDVSKSLRTDLASAATVARPEIVTEQGQSATILKHRSYRRTIAHLGH